MSKTNTSPIVATFNQFLESTTFNGFKLLLSLKSGALWFLWSLILLLTTGASVYIIDYAWHEFTVNPAITTLQSREYPMWKVPFPAVAICSVNKISHKAVYEYANSLQERMQNTSSFEDVIEKLHYLSALIDTKSVYEDNALEFQTLLDTYDSDEEGLFDSKKVLEMLAPKCKELLIRCHWLGKQFNCEELFQPEATPDGFCCIFNYIRDVKQKNATIAARKATVTGSDHGLVVLMNSSITDYFYTNKNTIGFSIKVFNSISFPDATTGGLQEIIVNPLEELYLKLLVSTLKSEESLRPYSTKQRKCFFHDEIYKDYKNFYTYSNCLTKCKLRSIIALCNCIPFFAPHDLVEDNVKAVYCTMSDITCINRYQTTWNTYKPDIENAAGLEREMEDSLSCPNCLPLCSNTLYHSEMAFAKLPEYSTKRTDFGILKNMTNLTELSLIRVYFASSRTLLFKKDVIYTWYEILGYFGGLLGICLGCSIISLLEIVYFATIKLYHNTKDIRNENTDVLLKCDVILKKSNKFQSYR